MARTAAGGVPSSFSSSLNAFSLALRVVIARGWVASWSTSPGARLPTSSWLSAPSVRPCTSSSHRRRSRVGPTQQWKTPRTSLDPASPLWLFGSSNNQDSDIAGMYTGYSIHHFSHAQQGGSCSPLVGRSALTVGVLRDKSAPRNFKATTASTCRSASSGSVSAGDDGGPGALSATASQLMLRSLRTARDRGSVKHKSKKSKAVKGDSSSSAAAGALSFCATPGASSSDPRGGPKLLRLSKLLADRAIGTRSEVDALVRRGRVKVNGAVVRSPKIKLPVDCAIEVNGEVHGPSPLLVAFHKPKGVITSLSDDWDRKDLSDVLPKSVLLKHHPVGRLDADTSGLLLLSSDGALTHRLLSPRFEVEREYVASVDITVAGEEPGDLLVTALSEGVTTADGVFRADVTGIDGRDVRLVVREGKNRMVRRMLANAGYPVLELRRERYGSILLGGLAEGECAPVSGEALEWAQSVLQVQAAAAGGGKGGGGGGENGSAP